MKKNPVFEDAERLTEAVNRRKTDNTTANRKKHVSKYLEIWDKTTYRAHVCKFPSTDGLNRKLQIPFCLLNIMLRPSRLPGVAKGTVDRSR
jgi:hypothetical protein